MSQDAFIAAADEQHWALLPEHLTDIKALADGCIERYTVDVAPGSERAQRAIAGSQDWNARTPNLTAGQIKRHLIAWTRHDAIAYRAGVLTEDDEDEMDTLFEGWDSPFGRLVWLLPD